MTRARALVRSVAELGGGRRPSRVPRAAHVLCYNLPRRACARVYDIMYIHRHCAAQVYVCALYARRRRLAIPSTAAARTAL